MGYLHIDNLYKSRQILAFKHCYAMEKIHGTSAHIGWIDSQLVIFSGGEKHERFAALFDKPKLEAYFTEHFGTKDVRIYGEAYGGKQQGMSHTYGKDLKFIVFDVMVDDNWLSVPQAETVALAAGLEFVDYTEIPATLEAIDAERDKPSVQAVRNGITEPMPREGVVLRPIFEVTLNYGGRLIVKHKGTAFSERVSLPNVDDDRLTVLAEADKVAAEWVTPMRLEHVLDKVRAAKDNKELDLSDTPTVLKAMVEDVLREGAGEIVESKDVRRAISSATASLYKRKLMEDLIAEEV